MKVFFSWQSDLDPDLTQRPIRHELKAACLELERKHENCKFEPDEATRDLPGSPNIMQAIFHKIAQADAFVCDLTPVARTKGGKALANPNVLIELGFAVAELGWERIILLVNTHVAEAELPDCLPFDVEKHRASKFTVTTKDDRSACGALKALLRDAVEKIFRSDPQRPVNGEAESPEQRARRRDVRQLTALMELLPVKQVEDCIAGLPDHMHPDFESYHTNFEEVVNSSLFFLSCPETAAYLEKLRIAWGGIDRYRNHFHWNLGPRAKFEISHHRYDHDMKAYQDLREAGTELSRLLGDLVSHIHTKFPEIELSETDAKAKRYYEDLERRIEASFFSAFGANSSGEDS